MKRFHCSARFALFALFVFNLSVTVVTAQQSDAKSLRWKLQPGEVLKVSFDQAMKMESTVLDKPVQSSANMAMTMQWEVQSVTPQGVTQTKQTIERLAMRMDAPGSEPVVYDSAAPQPPTGLAKTVADSVQPLIGIEFLQAMSNRGEILDVQLSEEGKARLAAAPAAAQLNQVFSKEGLKSLLNQAATVLPEGPVRPGQQWKGASETKSPVGTLRMDSIYTYRGTEVRNGRPLERIDVAVQVHFGQDTNALGLDVKVNDQKNLGTMYFDARAGRFVESVLDQQMTMVTAIGDKTHHQKMDTNLRMKIATLQTRNHQVGQLPATRQPATAVRPSGTTRAVPARRATTLK